MICSERRPWDVDRESKGGSGRLSEYASLERVAELAAFIAEHGALGAELLDYYCGDVDEGVIARLENQSIRPERAPLPITDTATNRISIPAAPSRPTAAICSADRRMAGREGDKARVATPCRSHPTRRIILNGRGHVTTRSFPFPPQNLGAPPDKMG